MRASATRPYRFCQMKVFTVNLGPFQFAPSIVPLMAGVFFIAVFAGLGRWQVDRMLEKQEIEEQYRVRAAEPVQLLPGRIEAPEAWRFRMVRAEGMMLGGRQLLLDNQVRQRRAGYSVLTPMVLKDGRIVLIDRGWVPLVDGARERLPDVAVAADEMRTVEGRFYLPFGKAVSLGEQPVETAGWPVVISHISFAVIEQVLGVPVEKFIIRMDPADPNGYLREWPVVTFTASKHLGYAVQWFALSLTVFILLIVLNTKRRR